MQPMPAKTRTAVMVGAALLAVMVASFAVWSSRRDTEPLPRQLDELEFADTPADLAPAPSGVFTSPAPAETAATPAPVSAMTAVPEFHIVRQGETLSDISRLYYNTNLYAGDIEYLNQLTNPNRLAVGQELKLPRPQELNVSAPDGRPGN